MTRISRVEVVANVASGSVNDDAPEQAAKIFADFGVQANVCAPSTEELEPCLRRAVDAAPDLLVVIAGDGTARAAAEMCGKDGPMIAPLAGGTMNMLPHAIYGPRPWQDALSIALAEGQERMLGGGAVEGHKFLVAAVLGSPALWAPAREAARYGQKKLALLRAQKALKRAFTGRLRYNLDSGPREKAEALVFMCPISSRALNEEEDALEAAALNLENARDAFRLGFNALKGDWRDDPSVITERCQVARIWGTEGVPAILDGESVKLKALTEVTYMPDLVRVLAIPKDI